MKVFIGSSSQSLNYVDKIKSWFLDPHTAVPWNCEDGIRVDKVVFDELERLSRTVDGAIFIFSEDDELVSKGTECRTTRDNVLIEFGWFLGSLGKENVKAIVVGNPKVPSDLAGVNLARLPKSLGDLEWKKGKAEVERWVETLSPTCLHGLGIDIIETILNPKKEPVEHLLEITAPILMGRSSGQEIRALCSNKGTVAEEYYKRQFAWVSQSTGSPRKLRRIFVCGDENNGKLRFSEEEARGIVLHWDQNSENIQPKWIRRSHPSLRVTHANDLGFALFSQDWIIHWGTRLGTSSADQLEESRQRVGSFLSELFEGIWNYANRFDLELIEKLRM